MIFENFNYPIRFFKKKVGRKVISTLKLNEKFQLQISNSVKLHINCNYYTTLLASSQGTNVRELKGQRAIGKEMFLVEQGKKLRGYKSSGRAKWKLGSVDSVPTYGYLAVAMTII